MVWGPGAGVNGLTFADNAAAVVVHMDATARSASGRVLRHRRSVEVTGPIYGDGQIALSRAEALARQALSVPYQDLVFFADDGTPTSLSLYTRDSLSGVTVVSGPHFDRPDGPDFVNMRTCRFTAEGEFVAPAAAGALVSWQQTMSRQGNGGPSRRWRFPVNAKPIRQIVSPHSLVRVTQSGRAVGHLARPAPAAPLIPREYLVNEADAVTEESPRPVGPGAWVEWPVRWSYSFELANVPSYIMTLPGM